MPAPRAPQRLHRLTSASLALAVLGSGLSVAAPAAADSETLNPLDQSTQFDENLPVLDESVLDSVDSAGGKTEGTDQATRGTDATSPHLGPCRQDFFDAPPNGSFYAAITWMACEGITAGNGAGYFGKTREITRGETAQFLYRYSGERHDPGTARDFTDVTPGGSWFTAISWLKAKGYTTGYANGAFGPDDPISRGELAQFMYRFSGETGYRAPTTSPYADSRPGSAFYTAATWLKSTGLVAGYADGTFRTNRDIARGETAQFLYGLETRLNGKPAPPSPAPQPAPAPVPLAYKYVVIADDGLNLRSGAGTQYRKIDSLARNTKVVWTGRSKSVSGVTWREITVGSLQGWVHGGYLMRDFEAGNAKSALSRTGTVRVPTTTNGITRLSTRWQEQPNGYWCGPASIVIGLTAFGISTTQGAMSDQAQTDREGTWLHQMVRVMDFNAPASVRYTVTTVTGSGPRASYSQRIRFRDDMERSIKAGVPGLVNIAATPDEQAPLHRQKTGGRYTLRHHMPVVGYNERTNDFLVSDPWTKPFWVDAWDLADMTVTRGYGTLKR